MFHFNRPPRRPSKTLPCSWAGHAPGGKVELRQKGGTIGTTTNAGQGAQDAWNPDIVVRTTRQGARDIETKDPAVFPVQLRALVMEVCRDVGGLCFEPFCGSGTPIIAGGQTGRPVRAIDVALLRRKILHPSVDPVRDGDRRICDAISAERRPVTRPSQC